MTNQPLVNRTLQAYLQALRRYFVLWATPTITLTALAIAYASVRAPEWEASQSFLVRDAAIGGEGRGGRFDSMESMRAFQETVLEVARSRIVVDGALRQLGPPVDQASEGAWPTHEAVESLREKIDVKAPKGAEFGHTEIIYVTVLGASPSQAISRTEAVCGLLEQHLGNLQNRKATGITTELDHTVRLAAEDLEQATARLESIEREVGRDLGELRILNDSGAGESNLRMSLNQVASETRQANADINAQGELRQLLLSVHNNPEHLLATPSRLLESQPALRRLKDGLVDAQLNTATLRGRMSDAHPEVMGAIRAEEEVRQNLHAEIGAALQGLEADLRVSGGRLQSLQLQSDELRSRLDRVSQLCARYSNLVDDVRQRTEIFEEAKASLAGARARQDASRSSSLITPFHDPVANDSPEGPSNAVIVGLGAVGGLMSGLGLLFVVAPLRHIQGRRLTDRLSFGRRVSDRGKDRRAGDRTAPAGRSEAASPEADRPAARRKQPTEFLPDSDEKSVEDSVQEMLASSWDFNNEAG